MSGRAGQEPGGATERPARLLGLLLLCGLAFALSQTLVLPALPAIGAAYGAGPGATSWVLTGHLLAAAVTTPLVGALGDRLGQGRVLAAVVAVFSAGSLVAALAPDVGTLLLGRVLQGCGGGIFPLAFSIVRVALPPARVPGAVSALSAVLGVGAGIGLPLSGVIVDQLSVPWLSWCALLALPAVVLAPRWVPAAPRRSDGRVDWAGAMLLAAGLSALLLAVTGAPAAGSRSPVTVGLLLAGVGVLAAWVRVERWVTEPLVALAVLRHPAVSAANAAAFTVGFAMFAGFLLTPQLAQLPASTGHGFGVSATVAGLVMLPSAVGQLLAAPATAKLGAARGFRIPLVLGAALLVVSFGGLAVLHDRLWHLLLGGLVLGTGIALSFASLANLVVEAVDAADVGTATGLNTVIRTVGGAFGGAASAAVLAAGDTGAGPSDAAFTTAFAVAAAAALIAVASATAVPRSRPA